ncbi:MAG: multicopper oxidase domain-containing protein, partial [Candidatus Eiseniibacteriota bacterium]
GMTRTHLYSGLAGFYLLLDPPAEANLPGGTNDHPADQYGNPYQLGVAIQDRRFDTDGQLYFTAGSTNPEHSFWLPEFFGDVILVNGRPWPYLNVEPRRYRFRLLNGSNARTYRMRLEDHDQNVMGPAMFQIGSDGGLMDQPVMMADPAAGGLPQLVMASGERADVVIDFSGWEGRNLTLANDAQAPFPDGDLVDAQTSVIMQFRVGSTVTGGSDPTLDVSTLPPLRAVPIERPAVPAITRALTLNEHAGAGGPLEMFVNNTMWDMGVSESPTVGSTEVWEIINLTMDTHPIHLHLVQYQLLDRQAFDQNAYEMAYGMPMAGMGPPLPYSELSAATGFKLGGNPDVTPYLLGVPTPPDPNERGWKDTFRMNPGEVTHMLLRMAPQDADALAASHMPPLTMAPGVNVFPFEPWTPLGQTDAFGNPGGPGYVWHCHIVDHEDNEMMRPLMVAGPGQPTAVVLARFDAVEDGTGVRVTWELSNPTEFAAIALERGDARGGPWRAVGATPAQVGRASVVLDRAVESGRSYWYRLSAVMNNGMYATFGPIEGVLGAPLTFSLGAVTPNPARGQMRMNFSLASAARLDLSVLDVQGREVAVLARGMKPAGRYQLVWDGSSERGRVPAGLYFVRYRTPQKQITQRVVIAR